MAEEWFGRHPHSQDGLGQIRSVGGRLRGSLPERSLVSIGVSVPGPTDAGRRKLLLAPHLGWRDVPVADALIENDPGSHNSANGVPAIVENDATAAAIYQRRHPFTAPTPGPNAN